MGILGLIIGLSILSACNKHSEAKSEMLAMPSEMPVAAEAEISAGMEDAVSMNSLGFTRSKTNASESVNSPTPSHNNNHKTKEKKIIKDGSLSLKSKELVESKLRLDALIKSLNGYYESENFTNNSYRNAYDLRIRVPSGNFEKLLGGIEAGKEEVQNKNISAQDVTEEFVDIETRLSTKRAYLQRYRELLAKAANVKEILEIEEQIRLLQEEIESQEGRLKYLSDQVSFSSLSVNLFQDKEFIYTPYEEASFFERMKLSLARGWSGIVSFVLSVISAWPLLILATLAWIVVRRWWKKRKTATVNR